MLCDIGPLWVLGKLLRIELSSGEFSQLLKTTPARSAGVSPSYNQALTLLMSTERSSHFQIVMKDTTHLFLERDLSVVELPFLQQPRQSWSLGTVVEWTGGI